MRKPKYYYKGISLIDYCKENELSYSALYKIMLKIENQNPDMPIDDVIENAINYEKKENSRNIKYYYEGRSLRDYCMEHNISYNTITYRIRNIKNTNPDMSIEEIIEKAISYERQETHKYYYKDKPVYQYCIEHQLSYDTILKRIRRIRKKNPDMPIDQVVENAINYYKCRNKYYYGNDTLRNYCIKNGLNIKTVYKIMKELKIQNPNMAIEEIIESAINYKTTTNDRYYYEGKSLNQYCKENGLLLDTVYKRLRRTKNKYPDMPIDEAIKIAINFEHRPGPKAFYYYNEKSLHEHCNELGIKYQTAYVRIKKMKANYDFIDDEKLIEIALNLKTIEDVLNTNMTHFLDSNGIHYNLNVDLAQEFLKEYFDNFVSENNSIKCNTENKVKKLAYEHKKTSGNKSQQ